MEIETSSSITASKVKSSTVNKSSSSSSSSNGYKSSKLISNRVARLHWQTQDLQSTYILPAPRSLELEDSEVISGSNNSASLQNPLVIGSIATGMLGVLIIAVIIISVWIRSKFYKGPRTGASASSPTFLDEREFDPIDADSTIIVSSISMSTLDTDEEIEPPNSNSNHNDTTTTTFYSARDVSITVTGNEKDCEDTSFERNFADITLSPI